MQRLFLHLLVAATVLSAPAARAGSHPRMVEAYAEKGFERSTAVWIAPTNERQAADPVFAKISAKLRETLIANGFQIAPDRSTTAAVTIQYSATASGMRVSSGVSVNDPSYRVVLITGYDVSVVGKPKIMWQTMMDEYGISNDLMQTVPDLVKAAGPYLGVSKTTLSGARASWCADRPNMVGSHIPVVCSATAAKPVANMAGYVTSRSASEPLPGAATPGSN